MDSDAALPSARPLPLRQEDVQKACLYANRQELIRDLRLPANPTIAEIGVAFGDFSVALIECFKPAGFYGFDLFELHNVPRIWGRPSAEVFRGRTHLEYYQQRLAPYGKDCEISVRVGDSSSQLNETPDQSFDLIYIDGDHEYEGVVRDAEMSLKKIKPDGWLLFNDYILFDHIGLVPYGIVQVVNDLCVNKDWAICAFAFQDEMFCDVALRKKQRRAHQTH